MIWPAPPPASHPYFSSVSNPRVDVVAHGGGQGHAPPNTRLALERAASMGTDVLEADVQITRDGVLILRYDDTLDRTTNMFGEIATFSWEELSRADAGAKTVIEGQSFADQAIAIPRLDEMLDTFPTRRWVLEIKNDRADAADALCDILNASGSNERVLVASFHDEALAHFRRACPVIATSMSSTEVRNFVIAARLGLSRFVKTDAFAMQIPTASGSLDLTHPRIINAARARGIKVQYWTINDPDEIKALIAAGADGIITDYVDRVPR